MRDFLKASIFSLGGSLTAATSMISVGCKNGENPVETLAQRLEKAKPAEKLEILQNLAWKIEQEGKEIFGERHTFKIPDFVPGQSYEEMKGRLVHPEFAILWNNRSNPARYDEARTAMLAYGYVRTTWLSIDHLTSNYEPGDREQEKQIGWLALESERLLKKWTEDLKPFFVDEG